MATDFKNKWADRLTDERTQQGYKDSLYKNLKKANILNQIINILVKYLSMD